MKSIYSSFLLCFLFFLPQFQISAQWVRTETNLGMDHPGIFFFDEHHGYLTGATIDPLSPFQHQGKIFKTNNGGQTWEPVLESIIQEQAWINDIQFVSPEVGFTSNRLATIYKTIDAGITWDTIHFDGVGFTYRNIEMVTEEVGYVLGWGGDVFKTSDSGENWEEVLFLGMLPYQPLQGITCISEDTCFIGGYNRRIMKTTNGGMNWNLKHIQTNSYVIKTIHCMDGNTCLAAGGSLGSSGGFILKTENGGEDWVTILDSLEFGLENMAFVNSAGYAVGGNETILKTTDYGDNWTLINSDTNSFIALREVILLDENSGYICGDQGVLYKMGISVNADKETLSNHLKIETYPNPFQENISFKWHKLIKKGRLEFINSIGQIVFYKEFSNASELELNTSSLTNGIYFYRIFEHEKLLFSSKIIKE